ncbi:MAG: hypothetical protein H6733_13395, partial [Alphaproteobacteria bacterium]|nr:hypothetical protein [Alphaproteobacteria bacterium]
WMAWRLVAAAEEDAWHLAPLLPIGPDWVPSAPVRLHDVGGVDGPPRAGGLLLARVVPGSTPPAACCALVLPEVPPAALLTGWFARLALPQLAGTPELATEELLRRGGHHLVAAAHRWWWGRRR